MAGQITTRGLTRGLGLVKAAGSGPALPDPSYGAITASKDGSTGQTYTINAAWTDVQWYRMALAAPYALTAIDGVTALTYVAQAADEGSRLAARGRQAGANVAAKALQVVLPPPILLESFDSLTGFVATGGALLTIENTDVAQGTGKLAVEGTGVANSGFTKDNIGTHDPATWGTIAQFYDAGWAAEDTLSVRLNFTRAGVQYPTANFFPISPLFQTPQPLFYGKMWAAQHVSEMAGLSAIGPGQIGISQFVTGQDANRAYGKKRTDCLLARAGGRAGVIIAFDDLYLTQYTVAFAYLKALGIKANIHYCRNYLGQSGRMTASMLPELYAAGWDMALNTTDDGSLTSKGTVEAAVADLIADRDDLIALGMTRGNEVVCYPNGAYQTAPTRPLTTITSTGSNVVTAASGTNIAVGQTMAGYGVPAGITVVSVAGTSVTLSGNVPAMTNRPVNFIDLTSPFSYTKLPLALKAAGFKMGRRVRDGASFHSRFGIGDRGGILMPSSPMSGKTLDTIKAQIDLAILRGETIAFYVHSVEAGGGIQVDPAIWMPAMDYIASKRDAGLMDPLVYSEILARDGGASVPV